MSEDLFEVTIRRNVVGARDAAHIVAARFRGREATATTSIPRDLRDGIGDLQVALQIGQPVRGAVAERPASEPLILREIGTKLFDILFRRDVFNLYGEARSTVQQEGRVLRLLIRLTDEMRELGTLPWEALYDSDKRECLAITERIGVARTANELLQSVRPRQQLRILCAIADATEEAGVQLDPLLFEREVQGIQAALGSLREQGQVRLDIVRGSIGAVEDRLLDTRRGGWDVFHFIGHGGFDKDRDEGYLVFVKGGSGSAPERVYADDLRVLLNVEGGPGLVVLNSCEGFRSSSGDIFASIGGHLAYSDIPFVVAMQFVFSDEAARLFSERFYGRLVRSESIYRAIWFARIGLKRIGPEWVTPVLFSRSPTGMICEFAEPAS